MRRRVFGLLLNEWRVPRKIFGGEDEDSRPTASQGADLQRTVPQTLILRKHHPLELSDGVQPNPVFFAWFEMIVMNLYGQMLLVKAVRTGFIANDRSMKKTRSIRAASQRIVSSMSLTTMRGPDMGTASASVSRVKGYRLIGRPLASRSIGLRYTPMISFIACWPARPQD